MIQEGDLAAQSGRAKQERVGHLNYNTYLASISRNRIAEVKEAAPGWAFHKLASFDERHNGKGIRIEFLKLGINIGKTSNQRHCLPAGAKIAGGAVAGFLFGRPTVLHAQVNEIRDIRLAHAHDRIGAAPIDLHCSIRL